MSPRTTDTDMSTTAGRLQRRMLAALLIAAAVLTTATACAASDPPPTSPFADPATPPPVQTGTPPPLPTFTPEVPPTPATPATPVDSDMERAAGDAISHIAEWTGEPETEFRVAGVEAVDWSSGCLGVEMPGIACTMAIVPGYRIELVHAGRPDGPPYVVHASQRGQYVWMPAMDSVRTVEAIEGNLVRFEAVSGSDEMGREHRVVPGSRVEPALSALAPGDRMHVAITWPLPGDDHGLVVWMVEPAE